MDTLVSFLNLFRTQTGNRGTIYCAQLKMNVGTYLMLWPQQGFEEAVILCPFSKCKIEEQKAEGTQSYPLNVLGEFYPL